MSSSSALLKVNCLVIRYLYFRSVRGDLLEGNGCASRCQFTLFPSTKLAFLCAFGVWNPYFRAFRLQNRGFCALLAFGTPVFGLFEHKIGVFVSEWVIFPGFWVVSSTKSGFLCFFGLRNPHFRAFRAQKWLLCVRMGNFPLVFATPEHKIWFFVRFCLPWPRVTNSEV